MPSYARNDRPLPWNLPLSNSQVFVSIDLVAWEGEPGQGWCLGLALPLFRCTLKEQSDLVVSYATTPLEGNRVAMSVAHVVIHIGHHPASSFRGRQILDLRGMCGGALHCAGQRFSFTQATLAMLNHDQVSAARC